MTWRSTTASVLKRQRVWICAWLIMSGTAFLAQPWSQTHPLSFQLHERVSVLSAKGGVMMCFGRRSHYIEFLSSYAESFPADRKSQPSFGKVCPGPLFITGNGFQTFVFVSWAVIAGILVLIALAPTTWDVIRLKKMSRET